MSPVMTKSNIDYRVREIYETENTFVSKLRKGQRCQFYLYLLNYAAEARTQGIHQCRQKRRSRADSRAEQWPL